MVLQTTKSCQLNRYYSKVVNKTGSILAPLRFLKGKYGKDLSLR